MLVRTPSKDNNAYERYLVAPTLTSLYYLCICLYVSMYLYTKHIIIISKLPYRYACTHNLWRQ